MKLPPVWRSRALRAFLLAALVSNIGNWMQIFTEQWLTLSLAGPEAARWGGRLAFASGLATLVFIPLGGWIADHLHRPRALAAAQLWLMSLALAMAVLAWKGRLGLHGLLAFALAGGVGGALAMTLGQSLVADLAEPGLVPAAMGLLGVQFNLSRILGPTVAAFLFPFVGPAGNFALNALTFLPLLAVVARMRRAPPAAKEGEVLSYREGWAAIRGHRGLGMVLVLALVAGIFAWGYFALLPVYGARLLGLGERGVAGLLSMFGTGAVLGGLGVAHASRPPAQRLGRAVLAFGAAGLCLLVLAAWPDARIAPWAFLAMGLLQATFAGTLSGLVMAWAPAALRGRINAVYLMAIIGVTPFGNLAAGEAAQALGFHGPRWVLAGEGLVLLATAVVATVRRRRIPDGPPHP
ncbi:MAG: MFS transporter [Holophagaceae bacterium]